jgi:hypothetical protein
MTRPAPTLSTLALLVMGTLTQALAQDGPPRGGTQAPGAAPAGAQRCVEPLSAPVRLSMTAEELLRALGKPRSDNRAFGGGLRFDGLAVMLDTAGREIWTFTITGNTRLACGHGVGDTLAKVREGFPGGSMAYDVYQVQAGGYDLGFRAPAGVVEEIRIRPSGPRFPATGAPAAATPAVALAALAGRWVDPRSGQSFDISASGRYRTPAGAQGTVSVDAEGLTFSGPLSAWNRGRATLTPDRSAIEFHWTNAEGAKQYFAFLKAGPSPGR